MTDAPPDAPRNDAPRNDAPRTDAIDRLIEKHGPGKICEALMPMLTVERIARIEAVLAARLGSVVTAVEDTYDPHNAAATLRTTESLGLQELHVIEARLRFSATHAVTKGAHSWLDLTRWPTAEAAIDALHHRGFRVYATAPEAKGLPARQTIEDVDVSTPLALVFGNEHDGVSDQAIAASDGAITVPMFGFTESFNLSVTVGMAMSRIATRRRAYLGATGDLDPDRRARLRARWFALKIRGVIGVLERRLA